MEINNNNNTFYTILQFCFQLFQFFEENNQWTSENLSNWISNTLHRVVTWLQPPGSKSSTFAPYLWDGPVLFLFTPRNPLHSDNQNYNLVSYTLDNI